MIEKITLAEAIESESIISIIREYTMRGYNRDINEDVTDCNTLYGRNKSGIYCCYDAQNTPDGSNNRGFIMLYSLRGYYYQEYTEISSGKVWHRYRTEEDWTEWELK